MQPSQANFELDGLHQAFLRRTVSNESWSERLTAWGAIMEWALHENDSRGTAGFPVRYLENRFLIK